MVIDMAPTRFMPGNSRRIFRGAGVTHRHFGGIARTDDGVIHLLHRRASEHGTVAEGEIAYCTVSNDGGGALSAEVTLAAPAAGRDLRDCDIAVTPSGRLVAHWTDCPAVGTGVGPVYFLSSYSDDNGASWSAPVAYDTVPFDYARTYGTTKAVTGTCRLVRPSYKKVAAGLYRSGLYWSEDDGATWAEGAPITAASSGGYNETDVAFIDAFTGFACARADGLSWSVTRDGGATWSEFQAASWSGSGDVAPSLNVVTVQGVPFLLLGYCDRETDETKWRWARADQLLDSAEAMRPHLKVSSGADMVNASGYQKPVIYPTGEMLFVEYKEYATPDKSSDVRLVYGSPLGWIANESGEFTPCIKGLSVAGSPVCDVQKGVFSKSGSTVTAQVWVDLSAKGGMSGQIAVGGLPFKVKPGAVFRSGVNIALASGYNIGSNLFITGFAMDGTNEVRFNMMGQTGMASLMAGNLTDNFVLYLSVTYEAEE